jgi:hypothetical protein
MNEAEYDYWEAEAPTADNALTIERARFLLELEIGHGRHVLTDEEKRTGWWDFTASNGMSARVAVGWRLEAENERLIAEAEERERAAKAACPYVACTCGYHEPDDDC